MAAHTAAQKAKRDNSDVGKPMSAKEPKRASRVRRVTKDTDEEESSELMTTELEDRHEKRMNELDDSEG